MKKEKEKFKKNAKKTITHKQKKKFNPICKLVSEFY
jgi:hypothetical protein